MFRRFTVVLCLALLVLVAGCSKGSSSSSTAGNTRAGSAVAAAAGPCPTTETKKLAKTLFVVDAGVAAGAFKHWIYDPWKAGSFTKDAQGRVTAIAKAGIAGAFVANRLLAARKNVQSDPALCKVLIAPVDKLTQAVHGLVGKAKAGSISPADVSGASGALDQLRSSASSAGAGFKDKNASVPGL